MNTREVVGIAFVAAGSGEVLALHWSPLLSTAEDAARLAVEFGKRLALLQLRPASVALRSCGGTHRALCRRIPGNSASFFVCVMANAAAAPPGLAHAALEAVVSACRALEVRSAALVHRSVALALCCDEVVHACAAGFLDPAVVADWTATLASRALLEPVASPTVALCRFTPTRHGGASSAAGSARPPKKAAAAAQQQRQFAEDLELAQSLLWRAGVKPETQLREVAIAVSDGLPDCLPVRAGGSGSGTVERTTTTFSSGATSRRSEGERGRGGMGATRHGTCEGPGASARVAQQLCAFEGMDQEPPRADAGGPIAAAERSCGAPSAPVAPTPQTPRFTDPESTPPSVVKAVEVETGSMAPQDGILQPAPAATPALTAAPSASDPAVVGALAAPPDADAREARQPVLPAMRSSGSELLDDLFACTKHPAVSPVAATEAALPRPGPFTVDEGHGVSLQQQQLDVDASPAVTRLAGASSADLFDLFAVETPAVAPADAPADAADAPADAAAILPTPPSPTPYVAAPFSVVPRGVTVHEVVQLKANKHRDGAVVTDVVGNVSVTLRCATATAAEGGGGGSQEHRGRVEGLYVILPAAGEARGSARSSSYPLQGGTSPAEPLLRLTLSVQLEGVPAGDAVRANPDIAEAVSEEAGAADRGDRSNDAGEQQRRTFAVSAAFFVAMPPEHILPAALKDRAVPLEQAAAAAPHEAHHEFTLPLLAYHAHSPLPLPRLPFQCKTQWEFEQEHTHKAEGDRRITHQLKALVVGNAAAGYPVTELRAGLPRKPASADVAAVATLAEPPAAVAVITGADAIVAVEAAPPFATAAAPSLRTAEWQIADTAVATVRQMLAARFTYGGRRGGAADGNERGVEAPSDATLEATEVLRLRFAMRGVSARDGRPVSGVSTTVSVGGGSSGAPPALLEVAHSAASGNIFDYYH